MQGSQLQATTADLPGDRLRLLLERVSGSLNRRTAVDDFLDAVVDLTGADRGLVYVLDPEGTPFTLNGRSHARALTVTERQEVGASIIAETIRKGTRLFWESTDVREAGSMTRWGILSALAAPLRAPGGENDGEERVVGALYVDFRSPRTRPEAEHVALFDVAASIGGAVLQQAQNHQAAVERMRRLEVSSSAQENRPGLNEFLMWNGLSELRDEVLSATVSRTPMLILGETGTGKTLLATGMAEAFGSGPVIRALLGTTDDLNTTASELFGHERGSFSGALARRTGLVAMADGGTLILDELLNLPLAAQKLLLDFTQFQTYRPLGYDKREPKRANVRIIACTNGDVDAAMRSGTLRADLYFRLAGCRLRLPPLRQRRDDIVPIARGILARAYEDSWRATDEFLSALMASELKWEGNVRQLEHVLHRAVDRARMTGSAAGMLELSHLSAGDLGVEEIPAAPLSIATVMPPSEGPAGSSREEILRSWQALQTQRDELDQQERRIIDVSLKFANGVVAHAARALGIARTSLVSRIQTLGLGPSRAPDHHDP